eukprot:PhF_6_TR3360/c0_g2_i1/m.4778
MFPETMKSASKRPAKRPWPVQPVIAYWKKRFTMPSQLHQRLRRTCWIWRSICGQHRGWGVKFEYRKKWRARKSHYLLRPVIWLSMGIKLQHIKGVVFLFQISFYFRSILFFFFLKVCF